MDRDWNEMAKLMFNAYNAQGPNPGKTWDGRDVPPWEQTGPQVQGKWIAAAKAAEKYVLPPVGHATPK